MYTLSSNTVCKHETEIFQKAFSGIIEFLDMNSSDIGIPYDLGSDSKKDLIQDFFLIFQKNNLIMTWSLFT